MLGWYLLHQIYTAVFILAKTIRDGRTSVAGADKSVSDEPAVGPSSASDEPAEGSSSDSDDYYVEKQILNELHYGDKWPMMRDVDVNGAWLSTFFSKQVGLKHTFVF